jgi:hypothetical protein
MNHRGFSLEEIVMQYSYNVKMLSEDAAWALKERNKHEKRKQI